MSHRDTNKPTKSIALADYTRLTRITASDTFLQDGLAAMPTERLLSAQAWLKEVDPDSARFEILESDGAPMPDDVQRLHGKIFLNSLNKLRSRLAELLAIREAEATF